MTTSSGRLGTRLLILRQHASENVQPLHFRLTVYRELSATVMDLTGLSLADVSASCRLLTFLRFYYSDTSYLPLTIPSEKNEKLLEQTAILSTELEAEKNARLEECQRLRDELRGTVHAAYAADETENTPWRQSKKRKKEVAVTVLI